jgi:hypothetical protein
MSGNKEIVDLSLLGTPLNADLYAVQGGTDYRIRIGAANGLPYLDSDGLVPSSLLPSTPTTTPITVVTLSGNKTLALTDAQTIQYSNAYNITVPPNSTVAFPVGTTITIINSASSTSLNITRGSGVAMYLATDATNGTRTLEGKGVCTIVKVATDTWHITGVRLS